MVARLFAIGFIFLGTTFAWFILGTTISNRTSSAGTELRGKVESVWGAPQIQRAPAAADGPRQLTPAASEVNVGLKLQQRRKGLLWYATYTVDFTGEYEFRNPEAEAHFMQFWWTFPAQGGVYDDLELSLNGAPLQPELSKNGAMISGVVEPGSSAKLRIRYRSQGLDSWRYQFGGDIQSLPNFHLRVTTDFAGVDFDENSMAPTRKNATANSGWELDWNYRNLFAGRDIAVLMPQRVQPGPLAAEISYFAPVSLLFFFFALWMLTTLRQIHLHPMNYFFLACAFFGFHLLLGYLADHVELYAAFLISAAVSMALVFSYLQIVVGRSFAMREAALAQFVYLVLFSFAFFFKGFTGLAVTIGAILTLFVAMQLTGRIRWEELFAKTEATSGV